MSKSTKREPSIIKDYRKLYQWCEVCGTYGVHVHHIKTRGAGGTDEVLNLISLCPEHHTEVHTIGSKSFAEKYDLIQRFKHVIKKEY